MKRIIKSAVLMVLLTAVVGCEGDKTGTFTDKRDKTKYKWVRIGDQVWMAENLAYKPTEGKYWAYDNDQNNVAKYGYLYDWETALNACPAGWHLPSDEEWTTLTDYLEGEDVAGGKLKEAGTTNWKSPNTGATNESGFTALPGGVRDWSGSFYSIGSLGYWWSASERDAGLAWDRDVFCDRSNVYSYYYLKESGLSVRCVRD